MRKEEAVMKVLCLQLAMMKKVMVAKMAVIPVTVKLIVGKLTIKFVCVRP
jgi:hypothetical protein